MELKTFIKETLTQIVEGVKEAQEGTKETGAKINPTFDKGQKGEGLKGDAAKHGLTVVGDRAHPIQMMEFDVKLTVDERADKKEGIGVSVVGIKLGSDGEKSSETSSSSRIKFVVPIVLPVHEA